jgi:hypothetical protein
MRKLLFAAFVLGATPAMADEGDAKVRGMRISELGDFEGTGFKLQRFQGHATLGLRF